MIVGLGIDLMEIAKMNQSLLSDAFVRKVFTEAEITECRSMVNAVERFAGKFAAKEAFIKAIGKGIRQGIWFRQIEVLNEDSGAPYIQVKAELEKTLHEIGVTKIHVSVTHTKTNAAAVVILEGLDES